jgi:hypothetical protein
MMREIIPILLLVSVLAHGANAQILLEDPPPIEEGVTDPEDMLEDDPEDLVVDENPIDPDLVMEPEASTTPSSVTYPPYRIRYLADIIERDEGQDRLVEEGVFNTPSQANEVINILAHLRVATQVDCACEDYRRDAINAGYLEENMFGLLQGYGYVSRLVPSSQVSTLPDYVGVMSPYLVLSRSGFRDENYTGYNYSNGINGWNDQWGLFGSVTTPTLNPNDPRQYARVDHKGVFHDTRIEPLVQARVTQIMGGYRIDDPASLCAFAALDRSIDDMMSWVLIRDLRRNWSGPVEQP